VADGTQRSDSNSALHSRNNSLDIRSGWWHRLLLLLLLLLVLATAAASMHH